MNAQEHYILSSQRLKESTFPVCIEGPNFDLMDANSMAGDRGDSRQGGKRVLFGVRATRVVGRSIK